MAVFGGGVRTLTVQEFCNSYKIGRTKYQEEVNAGRLKVKRVGRRVLIPVEAAEEWLEACTPPEAA